MRSENQKKFNPKNERGISLVEAAIVLPTFLFTIFSALLIFGQCFRIFATYYAMFESMRLSSVRAGNTHPQTVLSQNLNKKLLTYQTGVKIDEIIARIPDGTPNGACRRLQTSSTAPKYWPSTCQAYDETDPNSAFNLTGNQHYILETEVRFMDLKTPWLTLPKTVVRSVIKTQDWN